MREVENKESCNGEFVWTAMKLSREEQEAEWRTRIDMTMEAVSEFYGIEKERILAGERTPQTISACRIVMYIARVRMGVSCLFVANALGKTRATVMYGVMVIKRRLEAEPDLGKDVDEILLSVASKFRRKQ